MSITHVTLTNPGAETGDTTGWTIRSGTAPFFADNTNTPHSGSWHFNVNTNQSFTTFTCDFDQEVDVTSFATPIDADTAAVDAYAWQKTSGFGDGWLYVQFLDSTHTVISTSTTADFQSGTYTKQNIRVAVPVNTRYIRIGAHNHKTNNANSHVFWDDFVLDFSDSREADYPGSFAVHAKQLVAYVLASQPAEQARTEQVGALAVAYGETSTGLPVYTHQVVAYALVKGFGDKRKLRAWTFPQDDHKFYILQLGNSNGTLVYDQLTQQWCSWQSPNQVFWRGEDGCDWEGFNVCCDTLSGKIFKIDPTGRLDYNDTTDTEDTPITSIVVGGVTKRFRTNAPCFMAELAISEGSPPPGIDASSVSISLSSNDTISTYSHGSITGTVIGDRLVVRWYGLGLMNSPGRVFTITDTGYARRIDGFNIEVGGQNGN